MTSTMYVTSALMQCRTSTVVEAVMRLLTRMYTGTEEEALLAAGLPMGDTAIPAGPAAGGPPGVWGG